MCRARTARAVFVFTPSARRNTSLRPTPAPARVCSVVRCALVPITEYLREHPGLVKGGAAKVDRFGLSRSWRGAKWSGTYPRGSRDRPIFKKGARRAAGGAPRSRGSQRKIITGITDVKVAEMVETIVIWLLRALGRRANTAMFGVQAADGRSRSRWWCAVGVGYLLRRLAMGVSSVLRSSA